MIKESKNYKLSKETYLENGYKIILDNEESTYCILYKSSGIDVWIVKIFKDLHATETRLILDNNEGKILAKNLVNDLI